ncbi:MAG: ribonuclease M5 [Mycoplasmatales bacterium]
MKTIIIVEGKSDTRRLKQIFPNVLTFETSGLGLDDKKILQLQQYKELDYEMIVFTDPDSAGETIRRKISENVEGVKHAFLNCKQTKGKGKSIGIEHASTEDIKLALARLYTDNYQQIYELADLVEYGIYRNAKLRQFICNQLQIGYGNNKKFLKQLNTFEIEREKLEEIIANYGGIDESSE